MSPEHRKALSLAAKKRWRRARKAPKSATAKPVTFTTSTKEAQFAYAAATAIIAGLRLFR